MASFFYFAYGSNLWPPKIWRPCPSARSVGQALLEGERVVYDKPSVDGSAKLSIWPDPDSTVWGVVYEINEVERLRLDDSEPSYRPIDVESEVAGERLSAITYRYEKEPHHDGVPYDWYVDLVVAGGRFHGLDEDYILSYLAVPTRPDDDPERTARNRSLLEIPPT